MPNRFAIRALRVLLAIALVLVAALQLGILPWLSGALAEAEPDVASLRWPMLVLSMTGLACVEVGIFSTLRLLGFTRRDEVFTPRALRWVDAIIAAFLVASVICLVTLFYESFTVSGPPLFSLMLLAGTVGGICMALLMGVMRSLLVQATTLRLEMEAVI
ncbi:DUF2975 domain-containing protein [Brachybacterium alimentarium]|uniref:DUF2975 domain-containing protein n=1 Tax=Brachybacterium alimentarium TaxID=47845 RepID=A0A2A3YGM8_9MICO|nr:DUF2975 domain-containing protein [Brachybacterium alimentarium]PCC38408.1 hypothetical protein CIK66_13935 [Brachybacterium alimentarium]RCS65925.1 DUF2975 domain-containing protein [Brachybacterium alimentarium]RCS75029.1 DUF2975 domain-containing protein [Brachybacterium alimentarium]RCS86194.1 DUF2975 domain-containing protein [Brachybacterium alimentarium]